jgi:hypothetical protein
LQCDYFGKRSTFTLSAPREGPTPAAFVVHL